MDINAVVAAVRDLSSEDLGRVKVAITHREEELAFQLRPGDRVISGARIRPKYLAGRTGTVRGHRGDKIAVLMDECGHYRVSGREWSMTPGSIQKIDDNAAAA